MMLELTLLATVLIECLLYLPGLWKNRQALSLLLLCVLPAASVAWFVHDPNFWTGAFLYITGLRTFNLCRVVYNRQKADHLLRSSRRVTNYSGAVQTLLIFLAFGNFGLPTHEVIVVGTGLIQYTIALGLLLITLRNIKRSHYIPDDAYLADRDLPSITVAIPARNETLDLEDCLHSILASDYPKLEVIVLDDSSQDKTPEIIKKFAHDGVRFVQGSEPDSHWLAKNFAYEHLAKEASGEFIVFCGVDVRFRPESIRRLVMATVNKQKSMISILPRRFTDSLAGSLIQPMRYWWELALPRRMFDRPPVLSTCWIIRRETLLKLGGFAAVSHNVIPESYFARELVKTDEYSFLRSDAYMGIETEKSVKEQRQTTIRVRYPELHKRPELAFGLIAIEALVLIGPFGMVIYDAINSQTVGFLMSGLAAALLVATHVNIVAVSSPPSMPIALINYPLAIASEMTLGVISMFKYEFSTVIWKGRKITPVRIKQEVIPKLPDF